MEIDLYTDIAETRQNLERREEIVLRALGKLQPTSGKLLDLGCGDGCFLHHAAERFPQLLPVGADLSPGQLVKARKRLPTGEFKQGTLSEPLPFGDNEFTYAFCGEVIEHLYDPDYLVKEMYRVLAPGGYLFMTTPNLFAWYNRLLIPFGVSPLHVEHSTRDASVGYGILRRVKKSDLPAGHLRIFHPLALRDLQELYGFGEISVNAAGFAHFPTLIKRIDDRPSVAERRVDLSDASTEVSATKQPDWYERSDAAMTAFLLE